MNISDLKYGVIRLTDVPCVDCGGEVFTYLVPDCIWSGLGFKAPDYACLACFAKRLNPKKSIATADAVADEIRHQRDRFGLGHVNDCRGQAIRLNPSGARRKQIVFYWRHGLLIPSPATLRQGRAGRTLDLSHLTQ